MPPLARHKITGAVDEYPQNIIDHRVLGKNLEPYNPDDADEFEEDKTVVENKRVVKTATPKSVQDAASKDKDEHARA